MILEGRAPGGKWGALDELPGERLHEILFAQEEPTAALWKDWRAFSGVALSLEKTFAARPLRILFDNVSVSSTRDDREFAPPATP